MANETVLNNLMEMEGIENPGAGLGKASVELIRAWLQYAIEFEGFYNSPVGGDMVIGRHWGLIGREMRSLLQSDLGKLNPSALDAILCKGLEEQGLSGDL